MSTQNEQKKKKSIRTFMNEDEKDCILRIIASTFVKEGEGYDLVKPILQRKLGKAISSFIYNNFMTTIMRSCFRFLEDFVTKETKKYIRPITFQQERIIRTPMINCRKWMKSQHSHTFLKIVNNIILKSTIQLTIQEALGLYEELISLIRHCQKRAAVMKNSKNGKDKMSRPEFDKTKTVKQKSSEKDTEEISIRKINNRDSALCSKEIKQSVRNDSSQKQE